MLTIKVLGAKGPVQILLQFSRLGALDSIEQEDTLGPSYYTMIRR